MRPVEMLFGKTGAFEVIPYTVTGYSEVVCRNSLLKKDNRFVVSDELGRDISLWIQAGKPGNIQDVFPELSVEQRELMISGMTNDEFEKACR